jgi:aspartyl protease family protein
MSDNPKQTPQDRTQEERKPGRQAGLGMLVISFALGIGLLTLFFDDMLEQQFNPNQRPDTQLLQSGGMELVLQRNRQGHYVMAGDISGEPATFLLDTGATDVVIPAELADSAGLQRGSAMRAMTANGVVTVYTTTIPTLHLGDITLYDVRASINPGMQGDTVLLGMSALRQVEFTQRADTLTLRTQP